MTKRRRDMADMTWQTDLKETLILYIIKHGGLVKPDVSVYDYGGWEERADWRLITEDPATMVPEPTKHMLECQLDLPRCSYEDADWYEFAGTFAEPSWDRRQGTDAIIYCACGKVQGRHWRYTGGLAYLIRAIT